MIWFSGSKVGQTDSEYAKMCYYCKTYQTLQLEINYYTGSVLIMLLHYMYIGWIRSS